MHWLQNFKLPDRQISLGGNYEAVCTHLAGENTVGLVMSVYWEHGLEWTPSRTPTAYPVTQVGYNTMLAMYKKN
jgi:hypothetical protein